MTAPKRSAKKSDPEVIPKSCYEMYELFKSLMVSPSGLTKIQFLELYGKYEDLIRHNDSICRYFEYSSSWAVRNDGKECRADRSFVSTSDNHGHCSSWLDTDTLVKGGWVKVYTRPDDLTVTGALILAQTFRRRDGKIVLSKAAAEKYKHTLVGNEKENLLFLKFCDMLNMLNAGKKIIKPAT